MTLEILYTNLETKLHISVPPTIAEAIRSLNTIVVSSTEAEQGVSVNDNTTCEGS
jgi:hypothetical protein